MSGLFPVPPVTGSVVISTVAGFQAQACVPADFRSLLLSVFVGGSGCSRSPSGEGGQRREQVAGAP